MTRHLNTLLTLWVLLLPVSFANAKDINITVDNRTGAVSSMTIDGDASRMNWVLSPDGKQYKWVTDRYGWGLGYLTANGKATSWHTPTSTHGNTIIYNAGGNMQVVVTRSRDKGDIVERYVFKNIGKTRVRLTDCGIYTPWNDNYPDAATCMTSRCNAHIWAEGSAAYVCALRMGAGTYMSPDDYNIVENRPLNMNRWQTTFAHRLFPDYFQSYGLGFFEYFQLAEDIGAEPLPVLNVGMACQFQNWNDPKAHVPVDSLQPYIQDCLDLIEFANGDTTTVWGHKRAEMGHPKPFNMKLIAVGNEQWDTLYYERLRPFVKAIKARYPKIRIIGTSGPDSEGKMFDKGWKAMREMKADLVDEHFYRNEKWFLSHGLRYESYDRKGPKVFAGEYACHGKGKKWNHFETSLYEAAFMTDLERNADIVDMATYAPLFAHIDGWQWRPDLIWFDNTRTMLTTSYYVQQMYACNKGTNVLSLTMNGKPVAGQDGQDGLFASAVADRKKGETIVKVANLSLIHI